MTTDFPQVPKLLEQMSRGELIAWLVEWRMTMRGSVSRFNLQRNLETRKTEELRRMIRQIIEVNEWWMRLSEPQGKPEGGK